MPQSDCLVGEQSGFLNFNIGGGGSHGSEPLVSAFKKLVFQREE